MKVLQCCVVKTSPFSDLCNSDAVSLKQVLFQICVIQNGNLDAPQRSTCEESSVIEKIALEKLGFIQRGPSDSQEGKPSQFWKVTRYKTPNARH